MRWRKRLLSTAVTLGLLLCAFPLAFALTLLLLPLWRWIEATYAIESIGHSGPADWCFWLIYALLVGVIIALRWPCGRPCS